MRRVLLAVVFGFLAYPAVAGEENLCSSHEVEVVACTLETNNQVLSICADDGLGKTFYRLGNEKHLELEVEFSGQHRIMRWVDPATYVTFFGFNKGAHTYIVGVPQEVYGARSFSFVQKVGSRVDFNAPAFCTSPSFGEKSFINEAIKDVGHSVINDEGFFLPQAVNRDKQETR